MEQYFLKELRRLFRYDAETGELLWAVSRRGAVKGFESGTVVEKARKPYRLVTVHGGKYREDWIIWYMHYSERPAGKIEHIDGNDLNCRIENMRIKGRVRS